MTDRLRMTYPTAAVLQALAEGFEYGFDIAHATGLRRGTVYPILRRLEEAGLLASRWEAPAAHRGQGRPPRKYYRLRPSATSEVERARATYPLPDLAADTATERG